MIITFAVLGSANIFRIVAFLLKTTVKLSILAVVVVGVYLIHTTHPDADVAIIGVAFILFFVYMLDKDTEQVK